MTVAEIFKPDGNAADMIDTLYDLMITARVPFGVAELQGGWQLFVLGGRIGIPVTKNDVLYELLAYLSRQGTMTPEQIAKEIKNATIDIN